MSAGKQALAAVIEKAWLEAPPLKEDDWPKYFAEAIIEAFGGSEHTVKVTETGWTLQHPITERLEDTLFECTLSGPVGVANFHDKLPLGVSRVWIEDGNVQWEAVHPEQPPAPSPRRIGTYFLTKPPVTRRQILMDLGVEHEDVMQGLREIRERGLLAELGKRVLPENETPRPVGYPPRPLKKDSFA